MRSACKPLPGRKGNDDVRRTESGGGDDYWHPFSRPRFPSQPQAFARFDRALLLENQVADDHQPTPGRHERHGCKPIWLPPVAYGKCCPRQHGCRERQPGVRFQSCSGLLICVHRRTAGEHGSESHATQMRARGAHRTHEDSTSRSAATRYAGSRPRKQQGAQLGPRPVAAQGCSVLGRS